MIVHLFVEEMEEHAFEKDKQLLEYQHLVLLSDLWAQCYKTFYEHNLRIFIIS
jgi:hypothetical protein